MNRTVPRPPGPRTITRAVVLGNRRTTTTLRRRAHLVVDSVHLVPRYQLLETAFPGEAALDERAAELCGSDGSWLVPNQEGWRAGDRTIICART